MLIETERLMLRPLTVADLDAVIALYAEPDVARFVASFDRAQSREWLERCEREWEERGYGLVAILDGQSGRFLGRSGLKYWPQFDETEVGWVLHPSVWGSGYATEAGGACIAWGFRDFDLPYLTAMIQPANRRSIQVAERLGMTPARAAELGGVTVVVHVLRRDEWR